MSGPLLVTGYEPFGGEPVNPSERLVRALDGRDGVATAILPVDRARLPAALDAAIAAHRPRLLLGVGQATGRDAIDLESVARNAVDYRGAADNGGHRPAGEPLEPDGPDELASPLPLAALASELAAEGLPVRLSRDAGRHLCNAWLYLALRRWPALPAAFVHVPLLPEQAARRGRGEPDLPEDVARACLERLLARLAET